MAQSSKPSTKKTKLGYKKTSKHPSPAPKSSPPDNSHFHSHPPTQPQPQSQSQEQAEADLQARAREAATHSPLLSWAYQTENSHLTLYEKLEKDRWECGGGDGNGDGSGSESGSGIGIGGARL